MPLFGRSRTVMDLWPALLVLTLAEAAAAAVARDRALRNSLWAGGGKPVELGHGRPQFLACSLAA